MASCSAAPPNSIMPPMSSPVTGEPSRSSYAGTVMAAPDVGAEALDITIQVWAWRTGPCGMLSRMSAPSKRTQVHRHPERGDYDRATIDQILD